MHAKILHNLIKNDRAKLIIILGQKSISFVHLKQTWNLSKFILTFRSSPSEVFLGKGVLKICSKCTGEHPCQCGIWIRSYKAYLSNRPLISRNFAFKNHVFLPVFFKKCRYNQLNSVIYIIHYIGKKEEKNLEFWKF